MVAHADNRRVAAIIAAIAAVVAGTVLTRAFVAGERLYGRDRELADLARQGVRTRFFGRRDRIPAELREKMAKRTCSSGAMIRVS